MTAREKRTVLSVFEALTKMRYDELNTFLGSVTIQEMSRLYLKLKYEDYCREHGIKYEDMTADDFADAYAQGY
jgi:hypothetical protein